MSRHAARRRGARAGGAVATLVVLTLVLLGVGAPGTLALFHDSATIKAGTGAGATTAFTSGSIATPVPPATQQTSSNVVLTWTATSVGTLGATASAYEVYRYPSATGGTGTLVCSTTSALTCTDASDPQSAVYYLLRARFATSWDNDSARTAYTPDVTPPTVVFTKPTNNYSGTYTALRTLVGSCAPAGIACGTAADTGGSGVALVEYTLKRTAFLATTTCWNGTAWVAATNNACTTYASAGGTTAWSVPGSPTTAYTSYAAGLANYTYTLTIRSTDAVGNASTSSITYTSTG